MVDEHFPLGEKLRIFVAHPLDTLRFVTAVWREFLVNQRSRRPDWSGNLVPPRYGGTKRATRLDCGSGHHADLVCGWQTPELSIEPSYLDWLRATYTRDGTRAVIWANPARDCDARISQYQENAKILGLPPTAVYDRSLFFDAFHLNTHGAARNATELANYLLSLQSSR